MTSGLHNRRLKRVIFSIIPLVVLFLAGELALRTVYYQRNSPHPLAWGMAFEFAKDRFTVWRAERTLRRTLSALDVGNDEKGGLPSVIRNRLNDYLYSEKGRAVLRRFEDDYAAIFADFCKTAREVQTRLVVMYLPWESGDAKAGLVRKTRRAFFRELARSNGVEFLDLTDVLTKHPVEQVTLLPENTHLSRLGNQIVAAELARVLDGMKDVRSTWKSPARPALLGDLKPGMDEIWTIVPSMPYRVVSNRQGLRAEKDFEFPKTRQRVLFLGDSFTFGPYLNNHDTYPALLQKSRPSIEAVNAGIAGYSIKDEFGLFRDRARHMEPDVTILQVLDNDISDMFYFKKTLYDRNGQRFQPTPEELVLITKIQQDMAVDIGGAGGKR